MYRTSNPTVAYRLANLYVDERIRDAEARHIARVVRRKTVSPRRELLRHRP